MKHILGTALLAAALIAAPQAAMSAPQEMPCTSQTLGGDLREFSCPLPAAGAGRRFRFKASFSGGHDDTMASMTATLNGQPMECATGSHAQYETAQLLSD